MACRSSSSVLDGERKSDEPVPDGLDMELVNLPPPDANLPVSAFDEVWAYVVAGREAALTGGLPITDIGYFGAEINSYGALTDVPNRRKLPAFAGRVHLVAACNGRALTHFVLAPGSPERKALIADLLVASRNFDGLQIDFELIPLRDADTFVSFLEELRTGLQNKMFTIAMKATYKKTGDILHDYQRIAPLVDRILIMAYDEHWGGSKPGPVASMPWCKRVAEYALGLIGREKLIMGIPFYGRAWGDSNPSRALVYSGIETLINENQIAEIRRENGVPSFDYEVPVSVKVYYEDDYSLAARMDMYRSLGVAAVGFWRLGQETAAVWNLLQVGEAHTSP
jgi:spore germination protein YaaH